MKAILLEEYWKKVVQTDVSEQQDAEAVQFETISAVNDLVEMPGKLKDFDFIVINMKESQPDFCMALMNSIIRSDKPSHAALMIFPSEGVQFENLSFLRNISLGQMETFKIVPIYFSDCKQPSDKEIFENLVFAVLLGKFSILISPLKMAYRDLTQVLMIVKSTCPPKCRVALITEEGLPFIQVHCPDLIHPVTYFGTKEELSKFQLKLSKDKTLHSSQPVSQVISEPVTQHLNTPVPVTEGSSTSPVKSLDIMEVFDSSQDSGIGSPDRRAASTSFRDRMLEIETDLDSSVSGC